MYNKDKLTRLEKLLLLMVTEDKKLLRKISKGDKELNYMVDKIEEMALNDGIVVLYDKEKAMERVNAINKMEAINEGLAEGRAKGLVEGRAEGLAEGRAKGLVEGKNIGINETKNEMAKKMLNEKISLDLISKITGLSKEEIKTIN